MPWLLLGVVFLLFVGSVKSSSVQRVGPGPSPPLPPQAPQPRPGRPIPNFREIAPVPQTLALHPGTTYLTQVEIPFLLGALVGRDQIRTALEAEGFIVIRADENRPDFWPSLDSADWYVVASYSGESRPRNIPSGIVRLWQAVAAPERA